MRARGLSFTWSKVMTFASPGTAGTGAGKAALEAGSVRAAAVEWFIEDSVMREGCHRATRPGARGIARTLGPQIAERQDLPRLFRRCARGGADPGVAPPRRGCG